jgi:hypothetical protein
MYSWKPRQLYVATVPSVKDREHEPVAQLPDVEEPGEFAAETVVNVEDEVHGVPG